MGGNLTTYTVDLPGGRSAIAATVPRHVSGKEAVAALSLPRPRGVVVVNGGTSKFSADVEDPLRRVLADGVAEVVIEEQLTVVTGGTDAGIFALFGQALADDASAPCVGVVPIGRVACPGREPRSAIHADSSRLASLERHHSHFLLVAADSWGDETNAMLALVAALSERCGSVVVLAGGGGVAHQEVLGHVEAGREVVVLEGTGRCADDLAAAAVGGHVESARACEIAASRLLTVVEITAPPSELAALIRARLGLERRGSRQ